MSDLPENLATQLAALQDIPTHRPIILSDADEVILTFVSAFEAFCETIGLQLSLDTLAITGNVTRMEDGTVLTAEEVSAALGRFFAEGSHHQSPVEGAIEGLNRLAEDATVIILTNIPFESRAVRQAAMESFGLHHPIIANSGGKGPAAQALTQGISAPSFFIDDLPPNHISVAKHAPHIECIHYVADERLNKLMPDAPDIALRAKSWAEIEAHIMGRI
ncbi:MAG: hypothetical protein ACPG06_07720 [Alphaproteobacteria bacterium]